MSKKITGHLDEDRIIAAIVDERELDFATRRHLVECADCRAQKEKIEGGLARFGELSRANTPLLLKRPGLSSASAGAGPFRPTWRIRPSIGMALVVASLLAFLVSPYLHYYFKSGRDVPMEKIYLEMLQDERLMAEIKNLEEDPLPRFYVEISDFSDQDAPVEPMKQEGKIPKVRDDKTTT